MTSSASSGLFRQLVETFEKIEREYKSLPDGVRQKLRERGFSAVHIRSLSKIINQRIKPLIGMEQIVQDKPKKKNQDTRQMTIYDFINTGDL